jgi:hypothetical protein
MCFSHFALAMPPPRRNQPERETVCRGQRSPVHLVAKDIVRIHGVSKRHAAREILLELDVANIIMKRDLAFIRAPKDDLDASLQDAGLLQDRGERCASPARVADAAIKER